MNEDCEDGHLCVCEKPKQGREKDERTPKDKADEPVTDQLDLSLPTPKVTGKSDLDDSDDDSDDDVDFPVGLTPIKLSNTLHEKDLVWAKWKKYPHIPGMIKKVYKKKKKVTIVFFVPEDEPVIPFTMHISRNIFSYFDPRKTEIMENMKNFSQEEQEYFKSCVKRADDFLMRRGLKQLDDDWAFFRDEDIHKEVDVHDDNKDLDNTDRELDRLSKLVAIKRNEQSDRKQEDQIDSNPEYCGLSKKGMLRKRKLKEKTKALTEFLVSDECKEYLFKIYRGEIKSDCHHIFMKGSMREKSVIKYQGFGPIDDEDQVETIVLTFHSWLNEVNTRPHLYANAYVFDVWVPEAIVFGLKKLHKYSTKKAWEKFQKGVRHTKEELQLVHEQLLRKSPSTENQNNVPLLKPPKRIKLKLS